MSDEVNWLEWGFKGLFLGIVSLGAYLWNNLVAVVKTLRSDHDRDIAMLDARMRDHQLEDARIYVTEARFKDAVMEMKDTVKRSHERLDDMATDLGSIRTLIVQTLNNKKH